MFEVRDVQRKDACKSDRSRQELSNLFSKQIIIYSNNYLLAKFGFGTAENEYHAVSIPFPSENKYSKVVKWWFDSLTDWVRINIVKHVGKLNGLRPFLKMMHVLNEECRTMQSIFIRQTFTTAGGWSDRRHIRHGRRNNSE